MPDNDDNTSFMPLPPRMLVAEMMALLEGYDCRSEVRLAFVVGDSAMQSVPTGVTGFTEAVVASPIPPPQPGTVWIIAARDTAPFPIDAWTPTGYRRP